MGATKKENFSAKHNHIAQLVKALGHPARVCIVEYLLKVDGCICSDIVETLPLSQPTISQHLKELKTAGIIKGNVEGNSICYCLDEKAVAKLKDYFENMAQKLQKKNRCK